MLYYTILCNTIINTIVYCIDIFSYQLFVWCLKFLKNVVKYSTIWYYIEKHFSENYLRYFIPSEGFQLPLSIHLSVPLSLS